MRGLYLKVLKLLRSKLGALGGLRAKYLLLLEAVYQLTFRLVEMALYLAIFPCQADHLGLKLLATLPALVGVIHEELCTFLLHTQLVWDISSAKGAPYPAGMIWLHPSERCG